ncbi:MAG: hypothetical protein M0D55_14510 [Elusimicrobiota bacterium]|nr:MAG: hypothetical protein M0D55_14510 [Elusimicrobiota bacterium]
MDEAPAKQESTLGALRRVMSSKPAMIAALSVSLLSLAYGAFVWKTYFVPQKTAAEVRYRSHNALMRLYDLQLSRHKAQGAFANDLDTLLAGAPDAEKLREELKATTDINTLAVIGDAEKFRLEANVLDSERTLVKFRGTAGGR